ncbi:MAG TPA: thioredoxin family protein [Magnetovibrio sp.]
MRRLAITVLTFWGVAFGLSTTARAAELVYFFSGACPVCERWDEEIGGLYDKTEESKRLPLRRHDIHQNKPDDLGFIKGVIYTPTFVLVEDGHEVGRMVGYVTDYFFWEQLSGLIHKADSARGARTTACSGSGSGGDEQRKVC